MRKRLIPIYSVLAVAIILLSVLVPGCDGGRTFALTMAVSPAGSGTAQDVTGTSPYASGAAVSIQASPAAGYTFVQWSAPAGTFANPTAAATTFTMPAQNVTVTAHFVGPLDHFKGYNATATQSLDKQVQLKDQFFPQGFDATVNSAAFFFNPTDKVHNDTTTLIWNKDHHFTVYWITHTQYGRQWNVEVKNQFGTQLLTVGGPVALAVPTQKQEPYYHEKPYGLDHYLLYAVVNEVLVDAPVGLKDEFGDDSQASAQKAIYFANPVQKTVAGTAPTPIMHPDDHLVFYKLGGTEFQPSEVYIDNQFEQRSLPLQGAASLLGVPSEKLQFGEQLDHFTVYDVTQLAEPAGKEVSLKDQFVDITTIVVDAWDFCNPAAKAHNTEVLPPIVHPDYHLTLYALDYVDWHVWSVTVDNQFGKQLLTVYGPVGLLVPAQKLVPGDHAVPVGLDHFLVYDVITGPTLQETVLVRDEFSSPTGAPDSVTVLEPYSFAVPVRKTVGTEVTDIKNPLTHLVFYHIIDAEESWPGVQVDDQFLTQNLTLGDPAWMLGVPSLKLNFIPQGPYIP